MGRYLADHPPASIYLTTLSDTSFASNPSGTRQFAGIDVMTFTAPAIRSGTGPQTTLLPQSIVSGRSVAIPLRFAC
jgi:hypothetical protein